MTCFTACPLHHPGISAWERSRNRSFAPGRPLRIAPEKTFAEWQAIIVFCVILQSKECSALFREFVSLPLVQNFQGIPGEYLLSFFDQTHEKIMVSMAK